MEDKCLLKSHLKVFLSTPSNASLLLTTLACLLEGKNCLLTKQEGDERQFLLSVFDLDIVSIDMEKTSAAGFYSAVMEESRMIELDGEPVRLLPNIVIFNNLDLAPPDAQNAVAEFLSTPNLSLSDGWMLVRPTVFVGIGIVSAPMLLQRPKMRAPYRDQFPSFVPPSFISVPWRYCAPGLLKQFLVSSSDLQPELHYYYPYITEQKPEQEVLKGGASCMEEKPLDRFSEEDLIAMRVSLNRSFVHNSLSLYLNDLLGQIECHPLVASFPASPDLLTSIISFVSTVHSLTHLDSQKIPSLLMYPSYSSALSSFSSLHITPSPAGTPSSLGCFSVQNPSFSGSPLPPSCPTPISPFSPISSTHVAFIGHIRSATQSSALSSLAADSTLRSSQNDQHKTSMSLDVSASAAGSSSSSSSSSPFALSSAQAQMPTPRIISLADSHRPSFSMAQTSTRISDLSPSMPFSSSFSHSSSSSISSSVSVPSGFCASSSATMRPSPLSNSSTSSSCSELPAVRSMHSAQSSMRSPLLPQTQHALSSAAELSSASLSLPPTSSCVRVPDASSSLDAVKMRRRTSFAPFQFRGAGNPSICSVSASASASASASGTVMMESGECESRESSAGECVLFVSAADIQRCLVDLLAHRMTVRPAPAAQAVSMMWMLLRQARDADPLGGEEMEGLERGGEREQKSSSVFPFSPFDSSFAEEKGERSLYGSGCDNEERWEVKHSSGDEAEKGESGKMFNEVGSKTSFFQNSSKVSENASDENGDDEGLDEGTPVQLSDSLHATSLRQLPSFTKLTESHPSSSPASPSDDSGKESEAKAVGVESAKSEVECLGKGRKECEQPNGKECCESDPKQQQSELSAEQQKKKSNFGDVFRSSFVSSPESLSLSDSDCSLVQSPSEQESNEASTQISSTSAKDISCTSESIPTAPAPAPPPPPAPPLPPPPPPHNSSSNTQSKVSAAAVSPSAFFPSSGQLEGSSSLPSSEAMFALGAGSPFPSPLSESASDAMESSPKDAYRRSASSPLPSLLGLYYSGSSAFRLAFRQLASVAFGIPLSTASTASSTFLLKKLLKVSHAQDISTDEQELNAPGPSVSPFGKLKRAPAEREVMFNTVLDFIHSIISEAVEASPLPLSC